MSIKMKWDEKGSNSLDNNLVMWGSSHIDGSPMSWDLADSVLPDKANIVSYGIELVQSI